MERDSAAADLLILGGGVTGAGIARLAARNGLRTVLLERADLASGSSSASSHMLHGGLRYLEHGRFRLVREALVERAALSRMAPALAKPRRFLVPLYRGGRLAPWKLRAGLTLYDFLAGERGLSPHLMVRPRAATELEPDLAPAALVAAGIYSDVVMDDAGLAIAVARDAAAHGAEIFTWHEPQAARALERGGFLVTARDALGGGEREFTARVLVNATGARCDETRRWLAGSIAPGSSPPAALLRPSRGVHLVYPALTRGHGVLLTARADGRVFFVVPHGEWSLVGTTEIEVPSPPADGAFLPTLEEVRYLRSELAAAMPMTAAREPLAIMSGLRPLLGSDEHVGRASREHRVIEDGDVISIAGGKYTTFRVMARDVLEHVAARLGRHEPVLESDDPLPAPASAGASLERLTDHAVEHEFARRIEDVLRRRTTHWLDPDHGRSAAAEVAGRMAERLGWSAERTRDELAAWEMKQSETEALLARSQEVP
ncbi:MAG: glycerol-3-phosphate dehydrogenase/oxidase [Candidatus Eiseniibacteriota bacterium]